ncbi:hypothetical protein WUBG_12922 [Wuchereria bancrofti]|uniref:Uncharacterized protein n=1 Tax=Wuchereria bancrofti TaxID=6293 RepID=J9E207_WUCBA|nr:hypothetical protein WUBG_12922 [Wuchereria bancrofti]
MSDIQTSHNKEQKVPFSASSFKSLSRRYLPGDISGSRRINEENLARADNRLQVPSRQMMSREKSLPRFKAYERLKERRCLEEYLSIMTFCIEINLLYKYFCI